MGTLTVSKTPFPDVFITSELEKRIPRKTDYLQEKLALQDLAARMAEEPAEILPRFVDLAIQMTGGTSAGLSIYEKIPAPGVFRWRHLRGALSPFDGATTPRNFSPCGVTLDQNQPVLSTHPERVYTWISDANITVPEVLLVPLYLGSKEPLGTLWIVSEKTGHFDRGHARAMTELASFVGVALRMAHRQETESCATLSMRSPSKQGAAAPFVASHFLTNAGVGRRVTKYRKNQKIFSQGDASDSICFIQKGRVKVTVASERGKEVVIAILNEGDFCGEGCLNGQPHRIATARALSDCEITRIEKNVFVRTVQDEPSLSALFLRHLLRRAIRFEGDLVDQLSNSSEKRLARTLMLLANMGNEIKADLVIPKISQETLAEMVGTTRSRVSFFMNKFRRLGFISYKAMTSDVGDTDGIKIHSALQAVILSGTPLRKKQAGRGSQYEAQPITEEENSLSI